MKKWNTPEVTELNINETANGKYTSIYEGYYGDCICGNDAPHGPICGHDCNHDNQGKDENSTPDEKEEGLS